MRAWRDSLTNLLLSLVKKLNNGQIPQNNSVENMLNVIDKNVDEKQSQIASKKENIQTSNEINFQSHPNNVELQNNLAKKQKCLNELEAELQQYRDNFEDDLHIAHLYSKLSTDTKKSLEGIFKDTSIKGLIACGIQESGISNLWDYIKTQVVNANNDDSKKLNELFQLLFERFTIAYPMFALQVVNANDVFDTQNHIKHHASASTSGAIEAVLLQGYVNIKTNKIIKQSVVVL